MAVRPLRHELNVQLPYAALLPAEAEHARSLVLTGLREALQTGDLQRGARFHCAALRRLIGLKIPLLDEERIELIHMLFALVTADVPLPLPLRTRWCGLLVLVLKRGKHLSLELPWRPLLAALLRHSVPKLRRSEYRSRGVAAAHLGALANVAAQCRRHFAEGTTVGLLAEIEPLLCPHTPQFHVGAALLSLLLPSHGNEATVWMGRVLELWVESGVHNCLEWELLWLLPLKRLAKDIFHGRAAPRDWAAILPTVYSRTLLLLGLPGGSGPGGVRPSSSHLAAEAGPLLVCQWGVDMTLVRARPCTVPCTHSCSPLHTAPCTPRPVPRSAGPCRRAADRAHAPPDGAGPVAGGRVGGGERRAARQPRG